MPRKKSSTVKQPRVYSPKIDCANDHFAIVVSKYNEAVTSKLLAGAIETLRDNDVDLGNVDVVWVPGAFEIPVMADRLLEVGQYKAIICLGAVIRGETTHDQHINRAVSTALMNIGVDFATPIAFGVLTCDTLEQALSRAGGSHGHKGVECAQSALQMSSLMKLFDFGGNTFDLEPDEDD